MHRYFKKLAQESSLPSSSKSENSPLYEECGNDANQPQQPINDANTNSIPFSTQRSRIDISALLSELINIVEFYIMCSYFLTTLLNFPGFATGDAHPPQPQPAILAIASHYILEPPYDTVALPFLSPF